MRRLKTHQWKRDLIKAERWAIASTREPEIVYAASIVLPLALASAHLDAHIGQQNIVAITLDQFCFR